MTTFFLQKIIEWLFLVLLVSIYLMLFYFFLCETNKRHSKLTCIHFISFIFFFFCSFCSRSLSWLMCQLPFSFIFHFLLEYFLYIPRCSVNRHLSVWVNICLYWAQTDIQTYVYVCLYVYVLVGAISIRTRLYDYFQFTLPTFNCTLVVDTNI